jgi:excisionase family DNA binding protein
MPELLTLPEVAKQCGLKSTKPIRGLIERGELEAIRVGPKLLRIPADALDRYLQGRRVAPRQAEGEA